jgi:uncharacterized protein (TIGR02996 family)
MTEEAFLQAILETPDDDAPRLVCADWLEEQGDAARAEFIRVQCALAGMPPADPRWPLLYRREQQLLADSAEAWAEPLAEWTKVRGVEAARDPAGRWVNGRLRFERGWPEGLSMRADDFLRHAPELFRQAPLRHLWLAVSDNADRLARCPHLANLRSLGLSAGSSTGPASLV